MSKGSKKNFSQLSFREKTIVHMIFLLPLLFIFSASCIFSPDDFEQRKGIIALPFPIAGLILGFFSLKKINDNPDQFTGKGFAIAGIIVSGILLLLSIGMFILGLVMQGSEPQFQQLLKDLQGK